MKKKIGLFGLESDTNYGDPVIQESVSYLFHKCVDQAEIQNYDLSFRFTRFEDLVFRIIRRFFTPFSQVIDWFSVCRIRAHFKQYLAHEQLDAIVLVGGGIIKYKYQHFDFLLIALTQVAEAYQTPVYYHAVGIEGYSNQNRRCQKLKQTLNRDIVKSVTTRDDYEALKCYIENPKISIDEITDSAIFVSEVYQVKATPCAEVIGIGLIRRGIFQDNGIELTPHEVVGLYVDLLKELDRRAIPYQLFTNGMYLDYEFGKEVLHALGEAGKSKSIIAPSGPKDLVQVISQFKGVIAARMHATIISYALGIPCIGLVWNDKLTFFGRKIHRPEWFITPDKFYGSVIVDQLQDACSRGYDESLRTMLEQEALESIKTLFSSQKQD